MIGATLPPPERRPYTKGDRGMTEIQGWILIAMVVIVIFSQWYVAKK